MLLPSLRVTLGLATAYAYLCTLVGELPITLIHLVILYCCTVIMMSPLFTVKYMNLYFQPYMSSCEPFVLNC